MASATVETTRAGLVSRLAALFVDAVVLSLGVGGATWFLEAITRALGRFAPHINPAIAFTAAVPLLGAIYNIAFWTIAGRTPGKWLLGLQVRRVGGGRVSFPRALLRFVGYVVSAIPFYAGFLWVLGPERRGWHDRLAGTEVVYVRRVPAEPSGMRLRRLWAEALARP